MGPEAEPISYDINDTGMLLNFERKTSQWKDPKYSCKLCKTYVKRTGFIYVFLNHLNLLI